MKRENVDERKRKETPRDRERERERQRELGISSMMIFDSATSSFSALLVIRSNKLKRRKSKSFQILQCQNVKNRSLSLELFGQVIHLHYLKSFGGQ